MTDQLNVSTGSGKKSVLILGATGYLGQFLSTSLVKHYKIGVVYHSTAAPELTAADVQYFWADLVTGEGLQEAFDTMGPVSAVINSAAISSPAHCEKYPEMSRSVNVPTRLLDTLDLQRLEYESETLLIHLSTDQVYDGTKSYWKETDRCKPVNSYGRSKKDAELLIQERWDNHVILRSSIIYGPQAPYPVSRTLFLQFIERTLKAGRPTKFFSDEFRSPVFVQDIISVIRRFIEYPSEPLDKRTFCMGGPERLSRLQMAETVAEVWGYGKEAIEAAESSSMQRAVASPLDISMDSSLLYKLFPDVKFCSFREALQIMRPPSHEQQ